MSNFISYRHSMKIFLKVICLERLYYKIVIINQGDDLVFLTHYLYLLSILSQYPPLGFHDFNHYSMRKNNVLGVLYGHTKY